MRGVNDRNFLNLWHMIYRATCPGLDAARWRVDEVEWRKERHSFTGTAFPWSTLLINIVGSFLIGVFAESFALSWDTSQSTRAFLVVGICGGYTTFSTFSLDIVTLLNRGEATLALTYVLASVVIGLAGLYAGLHAVRFVLA